MSNGSGHTQSIQGNVDSTLKRTDNGEPVQQAADPDGATVTANKTFDSGRVESESITTSETPLNSGTTLEVPDGAGVLVKNSLDSSNNMKLSLPNGSGSITYAPGGGDVFLVDDVSKISVQGDGGSITVEYALEENA